MVAENSVVERSSIKLVDESSVLVENTGLKLEKLDEKAIVYQSVFSLPVREVEIRMLLQKLFYLLWQAALRPRDLNDFMI